MSAEVPKNTDPIVQQKLKELSRASSNPQFPHVASVPESAKVPEGGFHLATISGVSYLYVKINGVLKRVAFI